MGKGKIHEIPFKISDGLNTNTSLEIVLLVNKCGFKSLIREVKIEKASGKNGIHFQIIWKKKDKKPIFVVDDITHNNAERLLYELYFICNRESAP